MQEQRKYDLEERTRKFALDCRTLSSLTKDLPGTWEDVKQLIRSSGSVAANYVEAREGLSKKDSLYRLKICRKEAKESNLWLTLLTAHIKSKECEKLIKESVELTHIFGAIVTRLSVH